MKKILCALLVLAMSLSCFFGCGTNKEKKEEGKIKIVTTIFPEYDWVMNVLGDKKDNADVTLLLDNGVDLHSYQPTADDILKISNCDLFIYVGGESDDWVQDVLKKADNKNMKVINLLDVLGDKAKEEEVIEGMQSDHEHEEGEEHEHDKDNEKEKAQVENNKEEEKEIDEHVWLSLNNAKVLVNKIGSTLMEIDKSNKDTFKKNTQDYIKKLDKLNEKYKETIKKANKKTLIFADRFPFRYMLDDYGLNYYAAFAGCSAETEASFKTVSFLSKKVDELSINYLITIEGSDKKLAKTIISNTKSKNQKVLTMDSMQSTTSKDIKEGKSYLDTMEKNLKVMEKAVK
ncbi:metal ABC transporter substrate-binding protein [Anaerofustis sp. NSJ-163]|uniref:metal ABC transporter substrate-binding protein n=1 Tax=Anaerofustis sp. NSJ-163 TaxID=2944391 RepID=UPI00209C1865|nr:metal ABC transporter substrate-binding protein [Anaerofustis sp. NSJ-163]MCO8193060.1 metal ABC transporter substrate-binding protein [Anaerofustis sp. NSJ-163]